MKPDWLPDWRDPLAYPNTETTDMPQWAWEFLRRNSQYQQDIKTIEDLPEQILLKLRQIAAAIAVNELEAEGLVLLLDCPQLLENLKLRMAIGEKYGLGRTIEPLDPAITSLPHVIKRILWNLDLPKFSYIHWEDEDPDCRSGFKPEAINEVVVKFDLNRPLAYQFECVRSELENFQQFLQSRGLIKPPPAVRKRRCELLCLYLRLLDAEAAGASIDEMVAEFFGHVPSDHSSGFLAQKRVRASIKAAQQLSAGGYLTLLKK